MVNCIFKQQNKQTGVYCVNCGTTKRKPTRRNCGLKKGLGDTIASVTKKVGIKPCGGCNKRRAAMNNAKPTPAYRDARLIYTSTLVRKTVDLCRILPANLDGVCGVPRSGMIPASVIATHLHLPLYTLLDGEPRAVGQGNRLAPGKNSSNILYVDDTVMNGYTMKRLQDLRAPTAAIFVNPNAELLPDFNRETLEPPHFLEWNLFNSFYTERMGFDMDGVICTDILPSQIGKIDPEPRYLPRNAEVTIITGRLERDRAETEDWLERYGVKAKRLIMFPGSDADRAKPRAISDYKAREFNKLDLDWFVESDKRQAPEIAERTGAWVICTEDGKVY
jgi:hypothetical protein